MNPIPSAIRLGLARGWLEFRQSMTNPQDLTYLVVINGILLVVLILQRGSTVDGSTISLASATLPSLLGMTVATGGLIGVATALVTEREDGTLLRAKTIPHGMLGYLISRVVTTGLSTVLGIAVLLVPGMFLIDGLTDVPIGGWLTLIWVTVIGLFATLPLGAIIGAVVRSPGSSFGLTFLPVAGLTAISGIFYPITAMAEWLQGVAQVFPVYWLGHGMRAALLPDAAAAAELGGSWRYVETLGVLGAWTVAGLLFAPGILRRMARRESGSAVEARKQQAMMRVS